MNTDSKNPSSSQSDVLPTSRLFDDWIDPIESGVRARVRDWIEALVHSELDTALQRPRYGRSTGGETEPAVAPVRGYRNGSRTRTLTGTFGKTDITVPRARLQGADGATTEWKSKALRAYQRRTKAADALIASAYLSGTNTRRVRRALAALFGGAVGKDTVSRVWRKVQTDLVWLRRNDALPYDWLADNTRWQRNREPTSVSNKRSSTPPPSIAKPSGRTPTPTSRYGWKRTPWLVFRSPPCTTCR